MKSIVFAALLASTAFSSAGVVQAQDASAFDDAILEATAANNAYLDGDSARAFALSIPLAEAGNPAGQTIAGALLTSDVNDVAYDPERGLQLLFTAASQGYPAAWYELGNYWEDQFLPDRSPNNVAAVTAFQTAIDLGHLTSYEDLSWHLLLGSDDVLDIPRGLDVLAEGLNADPGNWYLKGLLGDTYYFALGREANVVKALRLYEQAAADGSAYAAYSAGYQHYYAEGTEFDPEQAEFYLRLATDDDYADAFGILADLYYFGYLGESDYDEAFFYAQRGDTFGDPLASALLGYAYMQGNGVAENTELALAALQRGMDGGEADAYYYRGDMSYFGYGLDVDYEEAVVYYNLALQQHSGHRETLYALGYMSMRGEGLPVDLPAAYDYLEGAIADNSNNAFREMIMLLGSNDFAWPGSDKVRALAHCIAAERDNLFEDWDMTTEIPVTCDLLRTTLSDADRRAAEVQAQSLTP